MKICSKCGNEIHDDAVICVHCGCLVGELVVKKEKKVKEPKEESALLAFFLGLLSFFCPILGLIIFIISVITKSPITAKKALKGAIFGAIVWFLFSRVMY